MPATIREGSRRRAMGYRGVVAMVPEALHWLFWNVDVRSLDTERDAAAILGRVLERGRMDDVRWAVRMYGLERIERFFREGGHPEISRRTRLFWRAALGVRRDAWPEPEASRASSAAPWID